MLWDDHIGQHVTVVAEGQQTLRGKFLGTVRHDNLDFVHMISQWQDEDEAGVKGEVRHDEVFIQTRKIKSIHFPVEAKYLSELLELLKGGGK